MQHLAHNKCCINAHVWPWYFPCPLSPVVSSLLFLLLLTAGAHAWHSPENEQKAYPNSPPHTPSAPSHPELPTSEVRGSRHTGQGPVTARGLKGAL